MKRGKKMFIVSLSILGLLALITWGAIAYLGRSQKLSIKSIENPRGDLYFIHITKPSHQTWKAGAFAKFTLPDTSSATRKNEAKGDQTINVTIRMHTFGNLKMYKIDSAVIMILR